MRRALGQLHLSGSGPVPTKAQFFRRAKRYRAYKDDPDFKRIDWVDSADVLEYCPRCGRDLDSPGCGYCRSCGWEQLNLGCPGLVKQKANPRLLLLDFDTPIVPSIFRFTAIQSRLYPSGLRFRSIRYDRTARGWHVLIELNQALKPLQVVALQAICGSDPFRECFNYVRVMSGRADKTRDWNILFERKLQ